ncbi:hypothetical protein CPter291_0061 [Collimonas pratensis]|uniref:Uncharacterized protein n=2 Tax=Collimonas pratensis TaxID=279113 RepID=A0ABM5Z058_9BURK|nr:hypothetical protein CPter291_0061 [Collimonas pratensis]
MREDMFKVIVERPRCTHSNIYKGDGRKFRNSEDRPARIGMKDGYGHRKYLNENLAPLKRFLEQQVNRPWDKVYSEIRTVIDARSTVKQHILLHLDNFVAIETRWEGSKKDGRVLVRYTSWSGRYVELAESLSAMYVHPLTGILLHNRFHASFKARRKNRRRAHEQEKSKIRRIISDHVQLHLVSQVWYEVTLGALPPARVVLQDVDGVSRRSNVCDQRWDVLRKAWVAHERNARAAPAGSSQDYYGCGSLYAVKKRQLSSREIRDLRLDVPQQKQKAPKGLLFYVTTICKDGGCSFLYRATCLSQKSTYEGKFDFSPRRCLHCAGESAKYRVLHIDEIPMS